jgi:nucleotide-binding universal stress UspA family protein
MPVPTVVVGFDDSASARTALAWAADWARRTGAHLRAVHVLTPPLELQTMWYPGSAGWVPIPGSEEDQADDRKMITERFQALSGDQPDCGLQFAHGPVGAALVEAAQQAALLVVGTRRLRGLSRVVEGSVSHYCLSHAGCPVLAVPAVRAADRIAA